MSVDDEPGILLTRQAILEKEGYKVLSAVDGEQALRLFAVQAVDLVLLDYLMPRMDGGAVAQEMKKRKPLVPVIMVSGSSVPEDTLTCVDCFIRKGEGPALLLEKVERLLAESQQAQSIAPETTRGHAPSTEGATGKTPFPRRSSRSTTHYRSTASRQIMRQRFAVLIANPRKLVSKLEAGPKLLGS